MKRDIFFVGLALVFVILASFSFFQKANVTGNAISTITFPTDCSEANIKSLWDSIFKESSNGIVFSTNDSIDNGACDYIIATKNISQLGYVLYYFQGLEASYLLAKKTTFNSTSQGYTNITNEFASNNLESIPLFAMIALALSHDGVENRTTKITGVSSANSTFLETFKSPLTLSSDFEWSIKNLDGVTPLTSVGTFIKEDVYNDGYSNFSRVITGTVYSDYLDQAFVYSLFNETIPSCTPNWTKQETNCYSNETKLVFYNDSKNCNNLTGKPEDSVGYCDYNSNGIIGDLVSSSNSLNLTFYVSGSLLNSSLNYSNLSSSQLVEIRKDGQNIISFMYQFSKPLDLTNISIKLNSASSNLGFILVEGIDETKSVIFDKKNSSSNQVCIRDESVSSVSEISLFCDKGNEYLLNCPGTLSGYTCSIINNSFNISGLEHSGVKEMLTLATCTSNWICSTWSGCVNNLQTRNCSDINICNTSAGRPNLTQECAIAAVCLSNWSCSDWSPLNCSNDINQTRICTDKNNCNFLAGKPVELNICESNGGFSLKVFLWITFGVLLISLGVLLTFLIVNANSQKKVLPTNPSQSLTSQQESTVPQKLTPNKVEPSKSPDNPGDIPSV